MTPNTDQESGPAARQARILERGWIFYYLQEAGEVRRLHRLQRQGLKCTLHRAHLQGVRNPHADGEAPEDA